MAKKVMFTLSAEVVGEATSGLLLGEFNNWDYNAGIELEKQIDGSMKATALLEGGKKYEYRYLLNDGRWVNDQSAHQYVHISGLQVENCVILVADEINELQEVSSVIETKEVKVPAQEKVKAASKKTAAPKEKIVAEKTQNQEKVTPEKVTTPKVKAAPKNKTPKS